ncbi:MAG: hypothetical protein ACTSYM_09080 [Candidatus Baldrarchaeia archaeon]
MLQGYVFFDETYPSSWISEKTSRKILEFFQKQYKFKQVNAKELAEVMKQASEPSVEKVVVFSQDVIPNTVVDKTSSPSPNSLIKQFMNRGNTVIWLGDIPLLYIGMPDGKKQSLPHNVYKTIFYPNIISMDFQLPDKRLAPMNNMRITALGSQLGLRARWDSWRPLPQPPASPPHPSAFYPLTQCFIGNELRPVSYIYDYAGRGLSGFIRIYDCKLDDISEEFLEQLADLIFFRNPLGVKITLQNMREEMNDLSMKLEARFQALKSDINGIGSKIAELRDILLEIKKSKEGASPKK